MKLVSTAAVFPPWSLPKNIQLRRPTATPRKLRSLALLSIGRLPSSQYRQSAAQFESVYPIAPPSGLFGSRLARSRSIQTRNSSSTGAAIRCRNA